MNKGDQTPEGHLSCHSVRLAMSSSLRPYVGRSPPGSSAHGILQEEYRSGLSFPSPGDLPDPGIEPESLASLALADGFFIAEQPQRV